MSDYNAYANIINKKTGVDRFADTIENMQIKNPITPKQRSYNAAMGGFGAGLHMSQDRGRTQKMEELEGQLRDLTLLDKELKMKLGQNQLRDETFKDFGAKNYYDLLALDKAVGENDTDTQERLFKNLYNSLRQTSPEMAKQLGEPVGIKGDTFLFESTNGKVIGVNRKSVFEDIMLRMPEEQQRSLVNLQTSHIAKSIADRDKEKELKLSKTEAEIAKLQGEAKHYGSMQTVNQIDKDAIKSHRSYIEKTLEPRLTANKKVLGLYENLVDVAKSNPELVGRDLQTKVRRAFVTYWGGDPDVDYANLKSVEFEKMLRPILGAQLTDLEGRRVLGKFASLDNNIDALSKFLTEEVPETKRLIRTDENRLRSFNETPSRNIYDPKLDASLDDVGGIQEIFVKPESLSPENIQNKKNKHFVGD